MVTKRFLILAATLLALASCGIERKGGATGGRGPISSAAANESPFAPVQLVVHPLTRVAKDPNTGG